MLFSEMAYACNINYLSKSSPSDGYHQCIQRTFARVIIRLIITLPPMLLSCGVELGLAVWTSRCSYTGCSVLSDRLLHICIWHVH